MRNLESLQALFRRRGPCLWKGPTSVAPQESVKIRHGAGNDHQKVTRGYSSTWPERVDFPLQIQTFNGGTYNADKSPDHCPVCLNRIRPIDFSQGVLKGDFIEKVFRCPADDCERIFIARYRQMVGGPTGPVYRLVELFPITIKKSEHGDVIKAVSPDFVAIFGEAEVAEKYGLGLICGPGYKKALEFLIKDYVIRAHPDKTDEIKRLNLGRCITDYVADAKVKQVAARAVWLGNDETHYQRKWEEKDINDLKALISLTLHWIEMDDLTQKMLKDMPEGKS
jgi:hypothetical protein